MKSRFQTFDISSGSLDKGVNLVEASAGTGKTYAIAMVVLRAVAELDIGIEKILIVTFTRAATEELKSRIRRRLAEGRDILNGTGGSPDQTLADWAASVADKNRARQRLQLALYEFDRAAIFTIHGFCQRMLADQALESDQLFDVELLADIRPLQSEVAGDFWRNTIYPLASMPCSIIFESFTDPEELLRSVTSAGKISGQILPSAGRLEDTLVFLAEGFAAMSAWWQTNGFRLLEQLQIIRVAGGFKNEFSSAFEGWGKSLDNFFTGVEEGVPADLYLLKHDELMGKLDGRKYRGDARKKSVLVDCIFPGSELDLLLDAGDQLLLTLRVQLAGELQREVERRVKRSGALSYDDLVKGLLQALQGREGKKLRDIIRQRFHLVLIDEFQDTDNSQWYIFSELFAVPSHYLYLIGDPKQAIYKFRGADIHSYFRARSVADRFLSLDKNYRSHPFLVCEVNRLFTSRPDPFLLKDQCIDFHPVMPAKGVEDMDLMRSGKSLAGMVYCLLTKNRKSADGRWSITDGADLFKRFVTAEILRLLHPENPSFLKKEGERPLLPGDIAVLVRTNRQAFEYLEVLRQAGVPAIISSRESVFQSNECRDLLVLMQALLQPGEISFLKAAMTLHWFGFNGRELVDLWQDEKHFHLWYEQFVFYHSLWQQEGFMVMMNKLVVDKNIYPILSTQEGSERSITNIQHLFELVQDAEVAEHLQPGQILLWLQRMASGGGGQQESGELRLESDEDAIQIITMHSAKGLEYPVVFCPCLWYRSNRLASEKNCVTGHDEQGNLVTDLGSDLFETYREKGMEEEMAEDLRLLYVALTRAGIRCYTMWGDFKKGRAVGASFDSALGYMLFPEGKCSYQQQLEKLQELTRSSSSYLVLVEEEENLLSCQWHPVQYDLRAKLPSGRELHTDWQMSSYSALSSLSEDEDDFAPAVGKDQKGVPIPVIGLPVGPNFGNMVHDLLESISFTDLAVSAGDESLFAAVGRKYGETVPAELLHLLLKNIVTTPLPLSSGSMTLASCTESSCLKEMEFYFRMSRVQTGMINDILSTDPVVSPLSHRVMEGYLTGLIDLISEYGGRYYIVDYKTNYLGDDMEDYRKENLLHSMRSHNYGLQFWIYTLVLHRYLKNVVEGYNYRDHFGGVFYLFVRGMDPDHPGRGVFNVIPDKRYLNRLEGIFGGADGE